MTTERRRDERQQWYIRPAAQWDAAPALPTAAPLTARAVVAGYAVFTAPIRADIRRGHASARVGIAFDQFDARIAPLRLSRREIRSGIAWLLQREAAAGGVL